MTIFDKCYILAFMVLLEFFPEWFVISGKLQKMSMFFLQYEFKVSFLEIYNEVIRDLLGSGKDDGKHEIRLVSAGSSEVYVTDLTTVSVARKEQVCCSLGAV